ncbi:hypothetical protein PoB_002822500 [Plakobranchus ocellatus]|uniref:Uncharacterized protein n=1 Tax=Plakobranchus ocellatus TaxID=259542 RepID=A0AAV4A0Q1_9GAST|nr:hypothetical protein PoB_002822500 [Plakobranchus ocellatus]
MENKPRPLLQHRIRQELYPELEPGPPDKFIQSAQEFLADAYTGRDVTRPRDLYTFLSLGRVPTNLRSRDRQRLKSRSVNTDARRVTFGLEEVIPRRNSFEGIPDAYYKFDIENLGLEPLPPMQAPEADLCLKRRGQVNLSTTYIFAPTERLDETLKYNKKVVLPKIKTSESEREEIVPPSVLTLDSVHNVESLHDKKYQVVNVLSPKNKLNMDQGNHLFGVRPECVFINAQLGNRNPLLRDHAKADSNVPRVVPGLHDLRDYAGYPKEYWKLRSEKITQPADLEADMIDRDLYRLRQLSTLKLNSVEKTFPVKNDPFRKWRGKGGEPLFSPNQQRVPHRRRRQRYGPTSLSDLASKTRNTQQLHPPLAVTVTPLRISAGDAIAEEEEEEGEVDEVGGCEALRPQKTKLSAPQGAGAVPNVNINIGELVQADTTVTSITATGGDQTPQAIVEDSLGTYRKLQENRERDEGSHGLGKLTLQRQFDIKKRREQNKKMLKTSVVSVELDSLTSLNTSRRNQLLQARLPGLGGQASNKDADHQQDVADVPNDALSVDASEQTQTQSSRSETQPLQSKQSGQQTQKPIASVMSLNFNPPADFTTPPSYPDALYPVPGGGMGGGHHHGIEHPAILSDSNTPYHRITYPSPTESRGELAGGGRNTSINIPTGTNGDNNTKNSNNSSSRLRALRLEVFGERREDGERAAVRKGRTSFHPDMPAYRLDLQNYPPINPRQTCQEVSSRRSQSAGGGGGTGLLGGVLTSDSQHQSPCCSRHAVRHAPNSAKLLGLGHTPGSTGIGNTGPARRTGSAGPTVEIRFGEQGEVILTSSREAKGNRSSR